VWSDVWRGALAFFLVIVGIGLGYLFWRLGDTFARLTVSIRRMTDELVPVLNKTQTTVDGVNLELERVDDIMQSAVGATKSAERVAGTVGKAVTTPVKKVSGAAAGLKEGVAALRSRRSAARADAHIVTQGPPVVASPYPGPPPPAPPPSEAPGAPVAP
jgi:hypothetical protein